MRRQQEPLLDGCYNMAEQKRSTSAHVSYDTHDAARSNGVQRATFVGSFAACGTPARGDGERSGEPGRQARTFLAPV